MRYLYKIVCCVESVETRPPFLWVSCQSLEIAFRARTFPLWYFSLYIKLGWGGWFYSRHASPTPNLLPSFYILLLSFTCLNLGEKQDKRREEGGPGQAFNWEGSCLHCVLLAAPSLSGASPNTSSKCWLIQKIPFCSPSKFNLHHGLCHFALSFPSFIPPPQAPLK